MKARLSAKEAELTALMAKSDENEAELYKLQAEVRDLRYAVDVKDEKVNELQRQFDEAITEVETLRDVNAAFEAGERGNIEEEKSETVSNLQEALRQAREELSRADAEVGNRSEAIKQLEKSCSNLSRETSEMKSEIAKLKEDLAEAEVVLAEKDAKLKTVQVSTLSKLYIREIVYFFVAG